MSQFSHQVAKVLEFQLRDADLAPEFKLGTRPSPQTSGCPALGPGPHALPLESWHFLK